MFFLIRCVFWLTVVFSTIFSPNQNPLVPAHRAEAMRQVAAVKTRPAGDDSAERLGQMAQNWVTFTIEHFWSKARGGCAGTPTECVALAARLADFARKHSFDEGSAKDAPSAGQISFQTAQASLPVSSATAAQVPLPPLRPQRVRFLEKPAKPGPAHERPVSGAHAEKR